MTGHEDPGKDGRCARLGGAGPLSGHARPLHGRQAAARDRRAPDRGRPRRGRAGGGRGARHDAGAADRDRDARRVARGGVRGRPSTRPRSCSSARWRRGARRSAGWSGAPSTACAWSSPGRAPRPAASRRRCARSAPRWSSCRRSGSCPGSTRPRCATRSQSIHAYALVCLTSPNGVRLLFEALAEAGRDARALANATVAAIGPGTAAALAEHGIGADVVPERSIAEALVEALARLRRRRPARPRRPRRRGPRRPARRAPRARRQGGRRGSVRDRRRGA